jgi:hypothetical protein
LPILAVYIYIGTENEHRVDGVFNQ